MHVRLSDSLLYIEHMSDPVDTPGTSGPIQGRVSPGAFREAEEFQD